MGCVKDLIRPSLVSLYYDRVTFVRMDLIRHSMRIGGPRRVLPCVLLSTALLAGLGSKALSAAATADAYVAAAAATAGADYTGILSLCGAVPPLAMPVPSVKTPA